MADLSAPPKRTQLNFRVGVWAQRRSARHDPGAPLAR